MEQAIYERPEADGRCDAWILWGNGDVAVLMVPLEADGMTLTVAVARDIDGDGVFHHAEDYWLNDEDEATLSFLSDLVDGMSLK
jgi:hypothetical protein